MFSRVFPSFLFCFLAFTVQAQNSQVIIHVKFASTPTTASSSFTGLKYGKQCFYNIEVDDNSVSFRDLMNYFQGGAVSADGQTYPGKFFTDGCGNNVPYTASVAINVRSHHWPPDQQDGMLIMESGNTNSIDLSDLSRAVQTDCYPAVHGYYHDMTGYYIQNNFTQSTNISECADYIFQKASFTPRVFITPNADTGYNKYLEAQGYFGNSSTGVTDGYPQSPTLENIWSTGLSDISEVGTGGFRTYIRDFLDNWTDQTSVDNLKATVTALKNASSVTINKFRRMGTHGFDASSWPYFKSFIEHIETTSQDAIWVTTLQEALEYLETKRKLIKTETLQGNELTITLDYTEIPLANLKRDITLQVNSNAAIESITVNGAQRSTYNIQTGLINVFNQRTATVPLTVLPLKLISFSGTTENGYNQLQWQTASEQQIDHFEIERSFNGVQYTKLGQKNSKGQQSNTYSFIDNDMIHQDVIYYRLKIVDQDQKSQYSNVIRLTKSTSGFSATISPNPVHGQINLNIQSPDNEKATLIVFGATGQTVYTQSFQIYKANSHYILSNPILLKGNYTLKIIKQNGQSNTAKFIVLN